MKNKKITLLTALLPLSVVPVASADYKADIGHAALRNELGSATPTGANVKVTQAEASTSSSSLIYAPDASNPAFSGKTFHFPGTASNGASSHATSVGQLFYGNPSVASGITDITSFESNEWIGSLNTSAGAAISTSSRIANHSWVGNGQTAAETGQILRIVDRQVHRNEYIQVVGMANSSSTNPLLGSAYNVIAAGRTDGGHDKGSDAVDSVYVAGRTRPDVVAPQSTTSAATPIVSAAAALLVETGHSGGAALSNGSSNIAGLRSIYNAERSETVKAALMAGADRQTANSSTLANVTGYRSGSHQTINGLDARFGAGQVNVYNSYHIIAAGEQNSREDGGAGIGTDGFDYDPSFGGATGSNAAATYDFVAGSDFQFTASLVWNLGVSNNGTLNTTLHNLDLELFDATTQATVAASASTLDNTENLWVRLFGGHRYELRVTTPEASNFSWDYALAWHMAPETDPVPLPPALWLFGSALAGLGVLGRIKGA